MAAGAEMVVTVVVVLQPPGNEYCMIDVPGSPPVTTPVIGSMVATVPLLLLHVPPGVPLLRVVAVPEQSVLPPVIGVAVAPTVTVCVADADPNALVTV